MFKSETTSFHYFSPKESEYLKSLDMGLREGGAKRPLKGVRKCDRQTNTQTDRHTDIATYRKHRPKGRCFENKQVESINSINTRQQQRLHKSTLSAEYELSEDGVAPGQILQPGITACRGEDRIFLSALGLLDGDIRIQGRMVGLDMQVTPKAQ